MTDARLLLPAGGAWLGAGVAGWRISVAETVADRHDVAVATGWLAAVCAVVAAGVVALALLRRPHQPSPTIGWWHRDGARAVAVTLVGLVCGVGAAAVVDLPRSADPLAEWVDARATASVVGVVAGEPVLRRWSGTAVWQVSSWVEARVVAAEVQARGATMHTRIPFIVRMPARAVPLAGATIEVTGRLARGSPRSDAAAHLIVRSTDAEAFVIRAQPGPVDRVAQAMRTALRHAVADQAPAPASLVAGLSIGDESVQPAELTSAMRASGLSHLTAVSGPIAAYIGAMPHRTGHNGHVPRGVEALTVTQTP